jgi:hypothetical protein
MMDTAAASSIKIWWIVVWTRNCPAVMMLGLGMQDTAGAVRTSPAESTSSIVTGTARTVFWREKSAQNVANVNLLTQLAKMRRLVVRGSVAWTDCELSAEPARESQSAAVFLCKRPQFWRRMRFHLYTNIQTFIPNFHILNLTKRCHLMV